MAWKEFPYSYLSTQPDLGYRPYIKVEVVINGKSVHVHGVIDSGSQSSFINQDFAPLFGIDLSKGKRTFVSGIGGNGKEGRVFSAKLLFEEMGCEIDSPIVFSQFDAAMLLGQDSFFKNFKVLFEGNQSIFRLNKIPRIPSVKSEKTSKK